MKLPTYKYASPLLYQGFMSNAAYCQEGRDLSLKLDKCYAGIPGRESREARVIIIDLTSGERH